MSRLGAASVLGALLLVGCAGDRVGEGSPDAAIAARSDAASRLAEALRLARPEPQWSALLSPGAASGFGPHLLRASGAAFASEGFREAVGGAPMAFGARLSRFADGALEVRAGEAQVTARVLGARRVEGALVDADVVFADTHPSTDFVVGGAPGRVEAFWLLRDASAPSSFSLALELTGLVARVDGDAILFDDASGATRLHMPRPHARDANGTLRAATTALEGGTLTVALDTRDLAYPILLDPALEQVTWSDVGLQVPSWPPPGGTGYPRVDAPAGLQRAGGRAVAANGKVYLFGGATVAGNDSFLVTPLVTHLMEWDGAAWSQSPGGDFGAELVLGDPTHATADRVADFTWDPVRKKLVLFGGFAFGPGDPRMSVYEYDPIGTKTWTKVCADGSACYASAPAVTPGAPTPPSAVWAFGKAIVVHETGTYAWNPSTKVFDKFAATPDLKRRGAALAFDAARSRLVAYGDATGLSDTWETDGTTWTKPSSTGPLGVKNASLAYHAARKRVVLWASDGTTGGLWTWDGSAWTAVTVDGAGPPPRPNAAFTYDDARGKLLLVGGGTLGPGAGSCFDSGYSWPYDNNRDYRLCARIDTWTSTVFGGACLTSADCGAGTTCVDGVCCKTACNGTCQRCDAPGSIGVCTAVLGADDPGSCSGDSTCDATGACKKKLGQACSIGTECLSGNCADGYCCASACPGACESCNQAGSLGTCKPLPKGSAGKGCGYATCTGTSGTCGTTCSSDADCAPNAFCDATGACVVQRAKGGTCDRSRQCATGACVDAVCCDSACSGACDVCSAALGATTNGTCTVLPKSASPAECAPARCSGTSAACGTSCAVDADCADSGFCQGGVCVLERKKGESCDRTAQCAAGLTCADGVCCNEACDGACQACSALNKQSGSGSGECGPAKEGTNPRALCAKSDASTCGTSGLCGPTGACALYAAGTACGPSGTTSCDGDSVKGQTCDGLGACVLDGAGTPCAPGRCVDGACKTTCAVDGDCAADAWCTAGTCKKKSSSGEKCALDAQCASGFCADGVCCNARCDRACEACDQPGTEGTCTAVTGKPRLGHPACAAGEPGNPCSAAACDGVERGSCARKAGVETVCRAGSCEGGVETLPTTCDGSGACPAPETRACQPFACGADACKTSCGADDDCKPGFVCNTATSACTAGDKCAGTIVTRVDGTTVDCAPYVCESSGRCKETCAKSDDCAPGKICDGAACVDPVAPTVDEGGGCAVGARGASSGAALVLAAAAALARRRRARATRA